MSRIERMEQRIADLEKEREVIMCRLDKLEAPIKEAAEKERLRIEELKKKPPIFGRQDLRPYG
jgi:hypothetical protein